MTRFYEAAAIALGSLGLALLVVSVVLVPQSRALGQEQTEPAPAPVCDIENCQAFVRCWWNGNSCQTTGDWCRKMRNYTICKDCKCVPLGDPVDRCECRP